MKNFPMQRVPYTTKAKNNFQWAKDTIDYLVLNYGVDKDVVNAYYSDYDRKLSNYQLFNNQLNQKDFERECNPLGLELGQYKDEIQPYNKTYNKIQVLLGEEARAPWDFRAVITNPDGIKSKLLAKDEMLRNYVMSRIDEMLSQAGITMGDETYDKSSPIKSPEEINKYMSTTYLDAREHLANQILNVLIKELNLKDLKNDAFKHGLISGEELIYIGETNDNPSISIINPLGAFFHKSPEVKYVQDGLFAGYRTYMNSGDILDQFGMYLPEEDQKRIDTNTQGFLGLHQSHINPDMRYFHDNYYYLNQLNTPYHEGSYSSSVSWGRDWLVQHVEWRSQKEVGFLSYVNEFGDNELDIVSEDFEVPKYATKIKIPKGFNLEIDGYTWADNLGVIYTLEWGWIPEVWSGVRIGSDMYCQIGPKKYQFRSIDNPHKVKLGYHGLVYSSMNAEPIALMDRMKPFQYLYFIVMHKLKKLIAQDKGRIFRFDVSMVDEKIGLDKTLYYLTNLGIDFFNPLQNANEPGIHQRGKVESSIDWSVSDKINHYIGVLSALDQQISDVAGVTRQREGQTVPNEAVTNAQMNVQMSAIITDTYFQAHNKLWEGILNSLLEVTQSCWKNKDTITKQFVLDDLSISTLQFTPSSLANSTFGVFVVNSVKEAEVFNTLRQLSMTLLQSDKATFSDIISTLDTTSTQDLKAKIKQSENEANQRIQQQQQAQLESAERLQKQQQDFELLKQQRELDTKIKVAEINSFARQMDQDSDDNGIPDQFEVEKFEKELDLKNRKLDLEEKKLETEKEFKAKELAIKRTKK